MIWHLVQFGLLSSLYHFSSTLYSCLLLRFVDGKIWIRFSVTVVYLIVIFLCLVCQHQNQTIPDNILILKFKIVNIFLVILVLNDVNFFFHRKAFLKQKFSTDKVNFPWRSGLYTNQTATTDDPSHYQELGSIKDENAYQTIKHQGKKICVKIMHIANCIFLNQHE